MSTYITYTIDDLDAEIKADDARYTNRSDYATLRNRAYRKALAEYAGSLRGSDDIFIRGDTFLAPIAIGAAVITVTGKGLIYQVALPAGAYKVAGDSILVEFSTTEFDQVPRMTWGEILLSGSPTPYAFWENNGILNIFSATDLNATAHVGFDYYRRLDATQTAGTALDIKSDDFGQLVDSTSAFLSSYL